jgi:beta-1,4-N-acetylglucosaminyltransferase
VTENHRPAEVLLVCTGGGHLLQLWSLRDAWAGYSHAWVVASHEGSDVTSLLEDERVYRAHPRAARSIKKLFLNLLLALRLLHRLRPSVIVTTGAAVAVPFAWLGRLRGARVVWVESLARAEKPSLSCRLVAPIADQMYVQWPELVAKVRHARYAGTVFRP